MTAESRACKIGIQFFTTVLDWTDYISDY